MPAVKIKKPSKFVMISLGSVSVLALGTVAWFLSQPDDIVVAPPIQIEQPLGEEGVVVPSSDETPPESALQDLGSVDDESVPDLDDILATPVNPSNTPPAQTPVAPVLEESQSLTDLQSDVAVPDLSLVPPSPKPDLTPIELGQEDTQGQQDEVMEEMSVPPAQQSPTPPSLSDLPQEEMTQDAPSLSGILNTPPIDDATPQPDEMSETTEESAQVEPQDLEMEDDLTAFALTTLSIVSLQETYQPMIAGALLMRDEAGSNAAREELAVETRQAIITGFPDGFDAYVDLAKSVREDEFLASRVAGLMEDLSAR